MSRRHLSDGANGANKSGPCAPLHGGISPPLTTWRSALTPGVLIEGTHTDQLGTMAAHPHFNYDLIRIKRAS